MSQNINKQYAELVYSNYELTNKKSKSPSDETLIKANTKQLTKMELSLTANEIIASIKDAFKHIPPRT